MSTGEVRQVLDMSALSRLLNSRHGAVYQTLIDKGMAVQAYAVTHAKANEGQLRNSIRLGTKEMGGGEWMILVGSDLEYALWVHSGTGIYGLYGHRIVPRVKSVLKFKPRNSAVYLYRPSVTGQTANPFLSEGLRAVFGGSVHRGYNTSLGSLREP